jgi:general stress protein YciG
MAKDTNETNNDSMSVNEAGRRGGEATSRTHGREFYEEIGHKGGEKGGQRVRELIEEGKQAENSSTTKKSSR